MSHSASKRDRASRDIDISVPRRKPGWTQGYSTAVWVVVLMAFLVLATLTDTMGWGWMIIAGGAFGLFCAWLGWMFTVQRGAWSWMRLARKPAMLLAKGNAVGAEAALQKALARANRFDAKDHRRGMMLVELAGYQGNQGRFQEARPMFEEAIEILAMDKKSYPMDYFIALNNFAVLFIHLQDFMPAQHLLERALDLTLLAKKLARGESVNVTADQLQTMEFVLHMNLACIFNEIHELTDAKLHLREATLLFDDLSKAFQRAFHDHFLCLRARWRLEAGRLEDAWREVEKCHDLDNPICVRLRARLHVESGEFTDALELFEQALAQQTKKGALHHPEMIECYLQLATCHFELGQKEAGVQSVQEARSIVADFQLPRSERWRKKLEPWIERAKSMRNVELQRSLEAELQTMPATQEAIMILERLRGDRRDDA